MNIVFDDGRLLQLAKDSRLTDAFPFLRRINDEPKGGCGCKRNKVNLAALAGARQAIAMMSNEQKANLLALVGADSGQVSYVDHKRKRVTVLFKR